MTMDQGGDAKFSDRVLALAAALWPAQAASFRVCYVADGRHHCRAEIRHEAATIVAAGLWNKTAEAARDTLLASLQAPSPAVPWTHHAQQAQAAERARDWDQASKEWKLAGQAAQVFGGADEAQLGSMGERDDGAQRIRTWLHDQEQNGLRSTDWYLTEAGAAIGRGDQMLAHTLYRQAWAKASRAWRRDVRQDSAKLDLAIAKTKELEQVLALA